VLETANRLLTARSGDQTAQREPVTEAEDTRAIYGCRLRSTKIPSAAGVMPLAPVCIGGGYVGVQMYFDYVKDDLRRTMLLPGCNTLKVANMKSLDKLAHP
jgi:hypothetical protein